MKDVLVERLYGGKITNLGRVCDLVTFEITKGLEEKLYIHIQSFFRILNGSEILVCSEDMYRCQEDANIEEFEWDVPGKSIYDNQIKKYLALLMESMIINILLSSVGDIEIFFDNGVILQVLIDTTVQEEKYRIFDENNEVIFCS